MNGKTGSTFYGLDSVAATAKAKEQAEAEELELVTSATTASGYSNVLVTKAGRFTAYVYVKAGDIRGN